MKLTNQEIINALNALEEIKDKEFPILITYKIIANTEKLFNAYSPYDKARQKAKNDADLAALLCECQEVEIEKINKQELVDCAVTFTPTQLLSLKGIIDG